MNKITFQYGNDNIPDMPESIIQSIEKAINQVLADQKVEVECDIAVTLTDNEENIKLLKAIADRHPMVDKIELLPFRKICQTKYDNLKIPFLFGDIPEPDFSEVKRLEQIINND